MISICRVMIFIVTVVKTEFSLAGRRVKTKKQCYATSVK